MAVTNYPQVNKLANTGTAGSLGTFPVHNIVKVPKALNIVNVFGVTVGAGSSGTVRPTVGQLFPLGNR
jgi:hypothetical protein